jgi:signal transduction histidine kinase
MRLRIWPSVAISFAILLLLVPLFAWAVSREAATIDARTRDAHRVYRVADDAITEVRTNIYKAALLAKDAYLERDTVPDNARLAALRSATAHQFDTLSALLDATQHEHLVALQRGLDHYWEALAIREEQSGEPGKRNLPRRGIERSESVLQLAERIDELNEANLSLEERQIQTQQQALRRFEVGATGLLSILGLAVAVVSTIYLARLERVSEQEKSRAEKAEQELRRLSNQLVRAQEDERRTISRELHDEVGQILTGLRMELGSLSRFDFDAGFRQRLESVKRLAEEALRSVRNLALLLRPSMLDDLGLEPALRWQTKELSQRSGVPISLDIQGKIDELPETVRVCLYRTIQEALTNCVKHAQASRVSVTVKAQDALVSATVRDNGKGFDANGRPAQGLGLIGMQERVRALQGQLTLSSQPGQGTVVSVALPVAAERSAAGA